MINCYNSSRLADIERTYGQRKLLAQRTPFVPAASRKAAGDGTPLKDHLRSASVSSTLSISSTTPSATEGETATETDGPDTDSDSGTENEARSFSRTRKTRADSDTRFTSSSTYSVDVPPRDQSPVSQHDLFNRYFRKDVVLFHNLDLLRYVESWRQAIEPLSHVMIVADDSTNAGPRISNSSWLSHTSSWPHLFHRFPTAQPSLCILPMHLLGSCSIPLASGCCFVHSPSASSLFATS